jgi:hypothetical protein
MIQFATLWTNHPANANPPLLEPCTDSKGKPIFENQCSIRMSVCLVRSGISLAKFRGTFCWIHHHREHVLRAEELARWLDTPAADFVPSAEITKHSEAGAIAASSYENRQGIVLFRNFWGTNNQGDHIDLWTGSQMSHGTPDYFGRSEEIWFWDLE